jgi:hypothetical protein
MRRRIMQAATGGIFEAKSPIMPPKLRSASARAPRGAVGQFLETALTERPGSSIAELEDMAKINAPEISVKSVGNELRRMEDERYRRDRPNGYKWFLIGGDAEKETVEGSSPPTSTASSTSQDNGDAAA